MEISDYRILPAAEIISMLKSIRLIIEQDLPPAPGEPVSEDLELAFYQLRRLYRAERTTPQYYEPAGWTERAIIEALGHALANGG